MPEYVATLQLIGVAVLAVAAVVWTVVLLRLLGRTGLRAPVRRTTTVLPALPHQNRVGPPLESVELTPAEQDAFAGLVRQLANG
ncbi:hypothetical protein [Streptomyces broussonetiae]|uniref:Uncharacterized protein n=1 Tax=Streptomyces broussonetiae TaxID=2686304 RepID=A0A6I6MXU4_9ACTN|nr:hypothetical protein [Streptomyces broussonetiae]QHA05233.1 hypothetical protein GQF42_19775 [Streptomyces broussonetiae]